jgi:putative methionine-R-sulfoxide reductase with GAF domain
LGEPLIDDGRPQTPRVNRTEPSPPAYSANTSIATDRANAIVPFPAPAADQPAPAASLREPLLTLALSTLQAKARQEVGRRAGLGPPEDVWEFYEQFMLDEVLQLVAERAQEMTGANGIAIALVEGEEIVCRASVGSVAPDRGIRLDPKSGFSGACVRSKRVARCDDSESDPRVDVQVCRQVGIRSLVAVPLLQQESLVGMLEAFSAQPFGLSDGDVRSLKLLAEHILAALKPREEERDLDAAKSTAPFEAAKMENLEIPEGHEPEAPATAGLEDRTQASSDANLALEVASPAGSRFSIPLAVAAVLAAALLIGGMWGKFGRGHTRAGAVLATAGGAGTTPLTTKQVATESAAEPGASASEVDVSGYHASERSKVTAIRYSSSAGASVVVIDLQTELRYDTYRLDHPDRIYVDLHDTELSAGVKWRTLVPRDGLLGKIRVAQSAQGVTRVVLETKGALNFSVRMEPNPNRLVIEVLAPVLSIPRSR